MAAARRGGAGRPDAPVQPLPPSRRGHCPYLALVIRRLMTKVQTTKPGAPAHVQGQRIDGDVKGTLFALLLCRATSRQGRPSLTAALTSQRARRHRTRRCDQSPNPSPPSLPPRHAKPNSGGRRATDAHGTPESRMRDQPSHSASSGQLSTAEGIRHLDLGHQRLDLGHIGQNPESCRISNLQELSTWTLVTKQVQRIKYLLLVLV
jgi:hypothetical protein